MDDVLKNVNRFVVNNFQDDAKQAIIEIILGKSQKDQQKEVLVRNPALLAIDHEIQERCEPFGFFFCCCCFFVEISLLFPSLAPKSVRVGTLHQSMWEHGTLAPEDPTVNLCSSGLSLMESQSRMCMSLGFKNLWSCLRSRSSKPTAMSVWPGKT